jgi:hypothetical protein
MLLRVTLLEVKKKFNCWCGSFDFARDFPYSLLIGVVLYLVSYFGSPLVNIVLCILLLPALLLSSPTGLISVFCYFIIKAFILYILFTIYVFSLVLSYIVVLVFCQVIGINMAKFNIMSIVFGFIHHRICVFLDKHAVPYVGLDRSAWRDRFRIYKSTVSGNHPHPGAARLRNSSSDAIRSWIRAEGFEEYSVSMSMADTIACSDGSRLYYQVRDLSMPVRLDNVTKHHIIKLCDVDYYVDMNQIMSYGQPIVISTFSPATVAGSGDDYSYTIEKDIVTMQIAGGSKYVHGLFDYNHDIITSIGNFQNWFTFNLFHVERRQAPDDPNRMFILLLPFKSIPCYVAWLAYLLNLTQFLVQRRFSKGRSNLMMVDHKVNFGAQGQIDSFTVPSSLYYTCCRMMEINPKYTHASVERICRTTDSVPTDQMTTCAFALMDACADFGIVSLSNVMSAPKLEYTTRNYNSPDDKAPTYQTLDPNPLEEGSSATRRYGECPISQVAAFASSSRNNDVSTVTNRIEAVRNDVVPPANFFRYAEEFAKLVVPKNIQWKGVPLSYDEVVDKQTNKNQRRRNLAELNEVGFEEQKVKPFMKVEAYPKPGPPRNISTLPTKHTISMSSFTLAFKEEVLKKCKWYLPGKTPREVANIVHEYVRFLEKLNESDYATYDGTKNGFLRDNVEAVCYRLFFAPEYRTELNRCLRNERNIRATTKHGVSYIVQDDQCSGSAGTTDWNTLDDAFIDYCARRLSGEEPSVAYANLGFYYGDDSITSTEKKFLVQAATILGVSAPNHEMKVIERVKNGPVGFLGRVFVNPWVTTTSIQDPIRTLSKAHLTTTSTCECDLGVAAYQRACGYLVTDSLSPVVSQYFNAVQRAYRCHAIRDFDVFANESKDLPYILRECNEHSEVWPQSETDMELMVTLVADLLQVTVTRVLAFSAELDEIEEVSQLYEIGTLSGEPRKFTPKCEVVVSSEPMIVPVPLAPIVPPVLAPVLPTVVTVQPSRTSRTWKTTNAVHPVKPSTNTKRSNKFRH